MRSGFKILIFFFIFTAFCTDLASDFFLMKLSVYSVENCRSDREPVNESDSPICIDTDTNDILNWIPESDAEQICSYSDRIWHFEFLKLSNYSLSVWQPPRVA
jgi:hypothetical protein